METVKVVDGKAVRAVDASAVELTKAEVLALKATVSDEIARRNLQLTHIQSELDKYTAKLTEINAVIAALGY